MADIPRKKITAKGLRNAFRLYSYIKPYSMEYAGGMFFLLGSSLASLAFPKLLGDLVNSGNEGNLPDDLSRIAILIMIILFIQAAFSYFRVILFVNVTEKSLALLRQKAYNHLINFRLGFLRSIV
jgi:ABC-type multidrug transport system fused ATPase/permease subunit